jgi:phosphatidylglycerophosphate synthase
VSGSERELTEGERWAREQLEALLARRFAPPAIGRFLWSSWRRSAAVRRERPQLARRAWAWMAAGALAWLALAAAGREPFRRRLRGGLGWWGATAVMLDWHLGMVETEDGRPRNLAAADALTLLRAWLIPVAADAPTPAVCALAAVTDTLDGRLARRGEPTRAGRDLEGLVDACFALAALRGARRRGWLGRRVVAGELARVSAGLAYAVVVWFGRAQPPPAEVLHAGRATTALRVAALLAAGRGRRRLGDGLMLAGSLASLAQLAWIVRYDKRAPRHRGREGGRRRLLRRATTVRRSPGGCGRWRRRSEPRVSAARTSGLARGHGRGRGRARRR